ARLLVMQPDLLLLDEPTNHLDLESLQWFQEYLKNYPGAIVMISHDREFLNQLVGSIVEIAHAKLVRYKGNWDNYVEQKAAREEQQLAAYKNQQKEIASLQLFADRFRAKATKASQAQSKLKQIDRMKKIAAPVARGKTIKFHFPQPVRSGLRVITLKDVDHAYGDLVVYRGMQYHGTLIFISHDVHFIRAIATSVLHVTAGANRTGSKLTFYSGDYDYYLDKSKATSARTALTASRDASEVNGLAAAGKLRPDPQTDGFAAANVRKQNGSGLRKQKEQKRLEAEARNAAARARREKEKRVHELETKIAALEGQQKELAAALEDPATYQPGGSATTINRDLSALTHDLARLMAEWESVTATVSSP